MKFRSLAKWDCKPEIRGLIYFTQRANELLFDYSLDTYKPPALNAPFLCMEALKLIDDINRDIIDKSNLKHVMDELEWSVQHDPICKTLLDLPRGQYLQFGDSVSLDTTRRKLEVLGRTIEPHRYFEGACKLLSVAVQGNAKNEIEVISRLFFTTLINIGLHKAYLHEKTINFFHREERKIDSNECILEYFDSIYPYTHNFEVIFKTSKLLNNLSDSLEAFQIEVHDSIPEIYSQLSSSIKFSPNEDELIVEVKDITGYDCYSAREEAERRLELLRDLYTLYHHKTQIKWSSEALISQCCIDGPRVISLPKNAMEKGVDLKPAPASRSLNKLLKSFRLKSNDRQKFITAVDFHGLSVNNSDPENQLLNLWIAIETLVPTRSSNYNKISQITDGLMPFIIINYLHRIINNLAHDLYLWDSRITSKLLKKVPVPKGTKNINRVLHLLTQENCKEIREKFYEKLKDFHLLRHRLFKLSESLSTPQKTLKMIEQHRTKVLWQIRRIYRTRNLIVHSGRTPAYIQTLIENGHDYLDQTLLTITQMLEGSYKVTTIEQAFDLASIAEQKLTTYLKSSEVYNTRNIGILVNEYDFLSKFSSEDD